MDPELFFSPIAAAAAAVLAVLGARRRSTQDAGSGPSAGERFARAWTDVSTATAALASGAGRAGTTLVAGGLETTGIVAGAAVRTAGNVSSAISRATVSAGGDLVGRTGGLVVDGVAAVGDALTPPYGSPMPRRRETATGAGRTTAPRRAAAGKRGNGSRSTTRRAAAGS